MVDCFDVNLIMICGALLKRSNQRPNWETRKSAWNLCARWKANNLLFLCFHFFFFCVYHISYSIFRRLNRYGNEQNIFICSRENQYHINLYKTYRTFTLNFLLLSSLAETFFDLSTCLHVFILPKKKPLKCGSLNLRSDSIPNGYNIFKENILDFQN